MTIYETIILCLQTAADENVRIAGLDLESDRFDALVAEMAATGRGPDGNPYRFGMFDVILIGPDGPVTIRRAT